MCLLSHVISEEMPLCAGKKSIVFEKTRSIKGGDAYNTMYWSFPSHIGTHVDVPLHFVEGAFSITDIKPEDWVFTKISLFEIDNMEQGRIIRARDVRDTGDCELLLIKTGFERHRNEEAYRKDSPALHFGLADLLKKRCPSLKAIGIDFISISNLNKRDLGRKAHRLFLGKDILLIEDMSLSRLKGVLKTVIVSPLLVKKAAAAPCTVWGIYN